VHGLLLLAVEVAGTASTTGAAVEELDSTRLFEELKYLDSIPILFLFTSVSITIIV
tara:strand:+ start:613 stop:780 length:168 start_codon:yes stop_codon:yes gene_type:complete